MAIKDIIARLDALGAYPPTAPEQQTWFTEWSAIIGELQTEINANVNQVVYLSQATLPSQGEWEAAYISQVGGTLPIPPSVTCLWYDTTISAINGSYGTTPVSGGTVLTRAKQEDLVAYVNILPSLSTNSILVVEDRRSDGVASDLATPVNSWITRVISEAVDADGIATVSGNTITLQEGSYKVSGWVSYSSTSGSSLYWSHRLYDTTGSTTLVNTPVTTNYVGTGAIQISRQVSVDGHFTIAVDSDIVIQSMYSVNAGTNRLGWDIAEPTGDAEDNVYTYLIFEKVG